MNFTILNRETVYKGRAFNVQKVYLRLPNEKTRYYDLVEHLESVVIIPIDQDGTICFVSQYRLGAQGELLELPAGLLEEGEDPKIGAMRELREETGMASSNLQYLGDFYLAPGYSDEHMFAFLATELFVSALEPDADEFINVQKILIKDVYELAKRGEIKDSKSLAALMLAYSYINR
jgi:ADP-ribose pyrophosphatase